MCRGLLYSLVKRKKNENVIKVEECAAFGQLCAQITISSTKLRKSNLSTLKDEFENYLKTQETNPEAEEDIILYAYFQSYIELRKLWLLNQLKQNLQTQANIINERKIYNEIQNNFNKELEANNALGLINQDENLISNLNSILKDHQYNLYEAIDDFFKLAHSRYKIPPQYLYKHFFINETKKFEEIASEAWEYFLESPNDFNTSSALLQILIVLLFLTGVSAFLCIHYVIK